MKILIFGAAGFIGSHLVRHAEKNGHDVVAFCRAGKVSGFAGASHIWALEDEVDEEVMAGADCAIHLAHDFNGVSGAQRTLKGTAALVRQLQGAGVARQLIFSSYSAGPHSSSLYGRTKSALESDALGVDGVIIIRPGLVLGEGGLYGRIRSFVRLSPLVPLPDGGKGRVPVIEISRLCVQTLAIAAEDAASREHNLFEREPSTLRKIVLDAAGSFGREPWIVGIPSKLVLQMLRIASVLRLPLPVNADNLEGFLANQSAAHETTLK